MNPHILYGILIYLLIINLTGFIAFGVDKRRAVKQKWRIRERTLFLFAILGGCIGCLLGMSAFHHKTKHLSFRIGMPSILVFQIFLVCAVFYFMHVR